MIDENGEPPGPGRLGHDRTIAVFGGGLETRAFAASELYRREWMRSLASCGIRSARSVNEIRATSPVALSNSVDYGHENNPANIVDADRPVALCGRRRTINGQRPHVHKDHRAISRSKPSVQNTRPKSRAEYRSCHYNPSAHAVDLISEVVPWNEAQEVCE
jgi:hypothetical protein